MKEIPIPAGAEARRKQQRTLARTRKALGILTFVLAAAAILSLIGLLVTVIVLEMRGNTLDEQATLYLCTGIFAAGAAALAFAAFGCGKLSQEATRTELDYRERCDGEESFFVGEGTLFTFGEEGAVLHAESEEKKPVSVPYGDLKFYSVCRRTKPREKGEWSVVIELPSHYVVKDKSRDVPPVVRIQAEGKARLYRAIAAHALTLGGEQPPQGKAERKEFSLRTKFLLPDRDRRRHALIFAAVAAAAVVAGVLIAVFWQEMLTIGVIVAVFGLFFAGRSIISFVRAKGMIAFYEEGVYWREGGRAIDERIFLKWEDIEHVSLQEAQGKRYLTLACAYGNYNLPDVAGAYEYIAANRQEKV